MFKIKYYLQLMRFDKPIGILLLLWPTLWALWIAARGFPGWHLLLVFVVGVITMRAAGCIINDIADRDLDGYVARTQHRPLVTKQINLKSALVLFFSLLFFALLLVLTLNRLTISLAFIGGLLAVLYPFTKRITHWPQLFLGLAFAWAVPMAFAAVVNSLPLACWILFVAALILPLAYDTQYAMVDREDDVKIGVKSTAILFGCHAKTAILLMQVIFLSLMLWLGAIEKLNFGYFLGLMVAAILFIYQQFLLSKQLPQACFKAFLNNNWVGCVIFLGLLFSLSW